MNNKILSLLASIILIFSMSYSFSYADSALDVDTDDDEVTTNEDDMDDDDLFDDDDFDIEDFDEEDVQDIWYEDEEEYFSDIVSESEGDFDDFIDEDELDDYLNDLDINVTTDDIDDFDDIENLEDVAWELWYEDADELIADLELENAFPEPESYNEIFEDIENDQYNEAIAYVEDMWIVEWYKDKTYKPKNKINRAELIKIIMESNYPGFEPANKECFPDVDKNLWFAKYVCGALEKWVIKWYGDWTFKPSKNVSSAESIKMILKAKWENIEDNKSGNWFDNFINRATDIWLFEDVESDAIMDITRWQMAEFIFASADDAKWKKAKKAKRIELKSKVKDMTDTEKKALIRKNVKKWNKAKNLVKKLKINEKKTEKIKEKIDSLPTNKKKLLKAKVNRQWSKLTPKQKAKIKSKQKQKIKSNFGKLSPEKRKQLKEKMQNK